MSKNATLFLPALLSFALVAFTIEFDNEAEHRMHHRTTRTGGLRGPWLVSLAMYANCMRLLDDDGITAAELERRARTSANLNGMKRWRRSLVRSFWIGCRRESARFVGLSGSGIRRRVARCYADPWTRAL